ncbi:MAG TPA: cysteine desulfurase [Terriglobales bacterium]|nr:cysteine desulfurase [Terriglobales bacterium]
MLHLGVACGIGLLPSLSGEPEVESLKPGATVSSEFPALAQIIHNTKLIYFDTAATAQRPQRVIDAVADFYRRDNANPAPNLHSLARRSFEAYERARAKVADFVGSHDPLEIIWTRGTTEGINLVASTWGEANIEANDEIVLTIAEHASNMLPWQLLAKRKGARLRYAEVRDDGQLDIASLRQLVNEKTKLVCFSHVSNVLGIINPASQICQIAHDTGAKVLIDAAQSVPHIPVDVQKLGCDFLAFSSHKMMGPMGVGVLWVRRAILDEMPPYQSGSNMAHAVSREDWEYSEAARKFSAGTPNVSGPVGLAAAVEFIRALGYERMWSHEQRLTAHLGEVLSAQKGLKVVGGCETRNRISLFCFTADSIQPEDLAHRLDQYGIAIRAGDMAALPLLRRFGIKRAARASLYVYNTTDQIDEFADKLDSILKS